jgi:hypothetical protein
MPWFRRRRGVDVGTYEAPNPVEPPPVQQIVDEGLIIADSVVRLKLRNRVIVDALRDRENFTSAKLAAKAAKQLRSLAANERETAERVRSRRDDRDLADPFPEFSDYAESDLRESSRRERVHLALADALEERSHDAAVLENLVEQARTEAWKDVAEVIAQRASDTAVRYVPDSHYELQRAERIAALIALDLADLAAERGYALFGGLA